tara:strand:+ start:612 stop:755 length:144 start_codon:yes stop_codon:yes gene_type:complete
MGEIEANTPRSTKQNERLAKRGDFGMNSAFFEPGTYPETIMSGKGTP